MPSKTIDFNVVREMALALPGVEESSLHGTRSLIQLYEILQTAKPD